MNFAYPPIPASLIALLDRYPVRTCKPVWGRYIGRHPSLRAGIGQEFRSHFVYTPGDDLRLVDWRAVARRDRLILRQTESEDELSVVILLDATAGMSYGNELQRKATVAFTLMAALATAVIRQGDRLGFGIIDGPDVRLEQLKPSAMPSRLQQLYHQLQRCTSRGFQGHCPWPQILSFVQHHVPRRCLILLCSDFLAPGGDSSPNLQPTNEQIFIDQLAHLRARGHKVHLAQILHRDELTFPWSSYELFRFDDLSQIYPSITGTGYLLRQKYLERIQLYLQDFRKQCEQRGIGLSTCVSDETIESIYIRLVQRIAGVPEKL